MKSKRAHMRLPVAITVAITTLLLILVLTIAWFSLYSTQQLNEILQPGKQSNVLPMRVLSQDGLLIAQYGKQHREWVDVETLPAPVESAFKALQSEQTSAVWPLDISSYTTHLARLAQQQKSNPGFYRLAYSLHFKFDRKTLRRHYMNSAYLGQRAYGIQAAAFAYYGKPARELNMAQAALLAGLAHAPSHYNPYRWPQRALKRRNIVLKKMLSQGFIRKSDYTLALQQKLGVLDRHYQKRYAADAQHFSNMVRRDMLRRYGKKIYTHGFRVYTTLNVAKQDAAIRSTRSAIERYNTKIDYYSMPAGAKKVPDDKAGRLKLIRHRKKAVYHSKFVPFNNLHPGMVIAVNKSMIRVLLRDGREVEVQRASMDMRTPYSKKLPDGSRRRNLPLREVDLRQMFKIGSYVWVRPINSKSNSKNKNSSWKLMTVPNIKGAMLALDADTGAIQAMVGDYHFFHTRIKENYAMESWRYINELIVPFVYAISLEQGLKPEQIINLPAKTNLGTNSTGGKNKKTFTAAVNMALRDAFVSTNKSVIDKVESIIKTPKGKALYKKLGMNIKYGIFYTKYHVLKLSTRYAVLANKGYLVKPYAIRRIDRFNFDRQSKSDYTTVYTHQATLACDNCTRLNNSNGKPATRLFSAKNIQASLAMLQLRESPTTKQFRKQFDLNGHTGVQHHNSVMYGGCGTPDEHNAWYVDLKHDGKHNTVTLSWLGSDFPKSLNVPRFSAQDSATQWRDYYRELNPATPINKTE